LGRLVLFVRAKLLAKGGCVQDDYGERSAEGCHSLAINKVESQWRGGGGGEPSVGPGDLRLLGSTDVIP